MCGAKCHNDISYITMPVCGCRRSHSDIYSSLSVWRAKDHTVTSLTFLCLCVGVEDHSDIYSSLSVWRAKDHTVTFLTYPRQYDVTSHLQRIQNYAARVILRLPKSSSITIHLKSLHWLPVKVRSTYKIACL